MDHPLPPLSLFLQIKLKSLSLRQTHTLKHKESHSKRDWSRISKTPPISHNQYFPPQEANFWQKTIRDSPQETNFWQKTIREFWQNKSSTLLFSNLSSGSWSIYCFGLYFLPLWHQAPKRDQSWPFNPIASPKSSIRANGNKITWDGLGISYPLIGVQWKSVMVQVHLFPFNSPLRLNQANSSIWLVSKGQVVTHLPLKLCITLQQTCEVQGVFVQLEHHNKQQNAEWSKA
jgi:hypothetical protein